MSILKKTTTGVYKIVEDWASHITILENGGVGWKFDEETGKISLNFHGASQAIISKKPPYPITLIENTGAFILKNMTLTNEEMHLFEDLGSPLWSEGQRYALGLVDCFLEDNSHRFIKYAKFTRCGFDEFVIKEEQELDYIRLDHCTIKKMIRYFELNNDNLSRWLNALTTGNTIEQVEII